VASRFALERARRPSDAAAGVEDLQQPRRALVGPVSVMRFCERVGRMSRGGGELGTALDSCCSS
jgi:hypothetical protein